MMRRLIYSLVFMSIVGCGGVKHLSLTDSRLPIEARRWLADAEDEVAITTARVVDAKKSLKKAEDYQTNVVKKLRKSWTSGRAASEGEKAWVAFNTYTEQKVRLAKAILESAETDRTLAELRLKQARAETAMRYDIAVYEIAPIVAEVEAQRKLVAESTKQVEVHRIKLEKTAGVAWQSFYQYAQKGGITNALWFAQ